MPQKDVRTRHKDFLKFKIFKILFFSNFKDYVRLHCLDPDSAKYKAINSDLSVLLNEGVSFV